LTGAGVGLAFAAGKKRTLPFAYYRLEVTHRERQQPPPRALARGTLGRAASPR